MEMKKKEKTNSPYSKGQEYRKDTSLFHPNLSKRDFFESR